MSENIEKIIQERDIKPTAMRILILKNILRFSRAFSLNDLETELETVDKSTVFRTLNLFMKNNLLHTIDDGSGSLKYALCDDNCECMPEQQHVHFYCTRCKKSTCLRNIPIPIVDLPKNISVESITYVVKGICNKC